MRVMQRQTVKQQNSWQLFSQPALYLLQGLVILYLSASKRFIWFFFSSWFFMISCAPIEEAIELPPRLPLSADCEIKFYPYDRQLLANSEKLAIIQYGDPRFGAFCTEVQVSQVMRRAACAAGGNSIMILEQQGPDLWSRCYQATAQVLWLNPQEARD